ncbi:cupin domain-containing protein [Jannaschia sp.]|nr:cupin domain-containing protein [Jannaschia sp.]
MTPVNLGEKLARVTTHWDPKVVADYNDNDVMVVKFQGSFPYHLHETTDDFFLVLKGEMRMAFDDRPSQIVRAGEIIVVPAGQVHRPEADDEVEVLLIEPKGEPNSGDSGAPAAAKDRL